MQFDENTYQYMEKASSQIEGITCALAVYIENIGDVVKDYHYRVYNDFVNEVREKQIEAIKKIKEIFCDTRVAVENMSSTMYASLASRVRLSSALTDFDEKLGRLVIHCENIRACVSNTENPLIADAGDEIYKSFAGYKKLLDDYPLSEPNDSDDVVSNLIYSYYSESISIYGDLFAEYDKMLSSIGGKLEVRHSALTKKSHLFKRLDKLDTAKTAVAGMVGVAKNVYSGDIFGAIEKGICICASLAEKYKGVFPKESAARSMLNSVETIGKTIELINGMFDVIEPDIKESSAVSASKLFIAASLLRNGGTSIQQMKETGKLDVLINAAGLATNVVSLTTSKGVPGKLLNLPKTASSGFGLYKAALKYYHKNNIHKMPKAVDKFLHDQAEKMDKYNRDVEEYKEKVIQKVPAKKPKAPPWMRVHSGVQSVSMTVKKGGVIYDHAKKIL